MRLHYAGTPGEGFGWGVCNANLIRELGKMATLVGPPTAIMEAAPGGEVFSAAQDIPDVVFQPLADHDFNTISASPARGKINVAYTFFEYPLGPNAAENAKKYDIVFCGSTWCLDRMKEAGITNGEVLIQGVDHSIFKPGPREKDNQFRIFSGGKFEYRKGQDLVIAAFKEFAKTHPEAHLVCSWFNPWPQLMWDAVLQAGWMKGRMEAIAVDVNPRVQQDFHSSLLQYHGIPLDQFTILPQLSQQKLAQAMQNTDCGLFPNRCEGGTNLVLMEYLSCGRPAIANLLTGHKDLSGASIIEIEAQEDSSHWAEQSVAAIVDGLRVADACRNFPPPTWNQWTWERAARQIVDRIEALTPA